MFVDPAGVKVPVKFGNSRSNRSRDIPLPHFVTNEDNDDDGRWTLCQRYIKTVGDRPHMSIGANTIPCAGYQMGLSQTLRPPFPSKWGFENSVLKMQQSVPRQFGKGR